MPIEVELKYRAAGAGVLQRLARAPALGSALLGPPRTVEELDRYLDTPDGRLAGARWACRLRRRGDTTRLSLKGPPRHAVAGALHRRPELEGRADDGLEPDAWPPGEAHTLLDELRSGRPLIEILRLAQRRTERAVEVEGVAFGTLSLDAVDVLADDRQLGTLHVVELELAAGDTADDGRIAGVAGSLDAIDGLVPEELTKLEHALDLLAAG